MNDKDIPLANSKVQYHTLLEEEGYSVSETTVHVGGETQWHHHTHLSDRFTVVKGVLTVEFRVDDEVKKIDVRDYYAVDPGVSHHVKNETDEDVVYIMVQSGGPRDIVLEPH
jgi:mannose-6-phosphate isomerase-like protein (cupin superfamily)